MFSDPTWHSVWQTSALAMPVTLMIKPNQFSGSTPSSKQSTMNRRGMEYAIFVQKKFSVIPVLHLSGTMTPLYSKGEGKICMEVFFVGWMQRPPW